jgi:hypothetical protein
MARSESDMPVDIRIEGREPIAVLGDLETITGRIEEALSAGTVLRLDADQGTLLVNGKATSTVVVSAQQRPVTAEPQNA